MTVRLENDVIRLEGICRVEDAEPLTALLQAKARPVDLSECRVAHTAVLQALLAFAPPICASPVDPQLRAVVDSIGRGPEAPAPNDQQMTSR